MDFIEEFFEAVSKVKGDDLAFIMQHVKAEQTVLGKIAYELSQQVPYTAVIEQKVEHSKQRRDIALMQGGKTVVDVEAKYYFSRDNITTVKKMSKDLKMIYNG
jgi:hypothetical protein